MKASAYSDDGHHWSGWPGAFCMKCFCDDPLEIAFGNDEVIAPDHPDGALIWKSEEIRMRVEAASECHIKGKLVWDEQRGAFNIKKPDGTIEPFYKDNMGQPK